MSQNSSRRRAKTARRPQNQGPICICNIPVCQNNPPRNLKGFFEDKYAMHRNFQRESIPVIHPIVNRGYQPALPTEKCVFQRKYKTRYHKKGYVT
jgi:hypothetical protein